MTLATLLLLRNCLHVQQMKVGDPQFAEYAGQAVAALAELDAEIAKAEGPQAK